MWSIVYRVGTLCSEQRTTAETKEDKNWKNQRIYLHMYKVRKNYQIIIHFNKAFSLSLSGLLCTLFPFFRIHTLTNSLTCTNKWNLLIDRTLDLLHTKEKREPKTKTKKNLKNIDRPPLLITIWSHIRAKMTVQKQTIPFR